MPFVPHTEDDVRRMLAAIGVEDVEDLFDEIPEEIRLRRPLGLPEALSEAEVTRLMMDRAERDGRPVCFAGAGAYDHHVPAAVWEIATRGELYTAYTPYQAEASQGTLQLLYEFQTMIAGLMAMEVANASLYDGASALAEAVLMAVRAGRRGGGRRVLMPRTVHPAYRRTVETIVSPQGIELVEIDYDRRRGVIDPGALPQAPEGLAALVVQQPNHFGCLEEAGALTDWAHRHGALVIGVANPVAAAVLAPPGEWGADGADIAAGEGQPLGVPLSSGGPYFGFLCARKRLVRQMPGRIVGRTVDAEGRTAYTLTLQAREQHIRRSKATSNICTNQGLMVTAATIHMALLGPDGLERVALASHARARELRAALAAVPGVEPLFPETPFFHEFPLRLPLPARELLRALGAQNVLGGVPLAGDYPELGESLLVCATETRTPEDIAAYARHLERIVARQGLFRCPTRPGGGG